MANQTRGQPEGKRDKDGRLWHGSGIYSKPHAKSGREVFYIRFTLADGRRPVEKAGLTLRQAERLLDRRVGEVAAKTYVNVREERRKAEANRGPTFEEFAKRFLRDHPGRRRSDHYTDTLRYLTAYFGERPLREITRGDLDRYRVHLLSTPSRKMTRPLSPTSVLKVLRKAHRVFKMAVRWGVLEANPASDLEKPSPAKPKTRFLTAKEFRILESASPDWLRPMLRFSIWTGMRLGEIAALRWSDVDLATGVLTVAEHTKTGSRVVPLVKGSREVLNGLGARFKAGRSDGPVFLDAEGKSRATPDGQAHISEETRKAAGKAGLPGVGFHTLRHTAASWMVQGGASLYEVQTVLGHSTPTMTQRYSHLRPEHLRGAVAALDAARRTVASVKSLATSTATYAVAGSRPTYPASAKSLNRLVPEVGVEPTRD